MLLRNRLEALAEPELVDHVERRGMDGVAAEVAEEVRVLLEHDDLDPGAGQQQPEYRARRTAADQTAGRGLCAHGISPRS